MTAPLTIVALEHVARAASFLALMTVAGIAIADESEGHRAFAMATLALAACAYSALALRLRFGVTTMAAARVMAAAGHPYRDGTNEIAPTKHAPNGLVLVVVVALGVIASALLGSALTKVVMSW